MSFRKLGTSREYEVTVCEELPNDEEREVTYKVGLYWDQEPGHPADWYLDYCDPEAPSRTVEEKLLEEACWKASQEDYRERVDYFDRVWGY